LWQAIPECALKRQILAELALAGRMETEALARMWGLQASSPRAADPLSPPVRRTRRAAPVRLPQDHVARMLLTDTQWWQELDGADREMLAALDTWHGSMFVWLEADLTEHGPSAWPALRERMAGQPFEDPARRLVDGAEFLETPTLEDIGAAVRQTARSLALRDPLRVLGRA
jgi:DNA primase